MIEYQKRGKALCIYILVICITNLEIVGTEPNMGTIVSFLVNSSPHLNDRHFEQPTIFSFMMSCLTSLISCLTLVQLLIGCYLDVSDHQPNAIVVLDDHTTIYMLSPMSAACTLWRKHPNIALYEHVQLDSLPACGWSFLPIGSACFQKFIFPYVLIGII